MSEFMSPYDPIFEQINRECSDAFNRGMKSYKRKLCLKAKDLERLANSKLSSDDNFDQKYAEGMLYAISELGLLDNDEH